MKKEKLTKSVSVVVALLTFFGIALHDTRLDTVTTMAIAIPVFAVAYESAQLLAAGDAHTHVEKVSLKRAVGKRTDLQPRTQTRQHRDKKYRLQKSVPKGHHPFDSYNLPLVA